MSPLLKNAVVSIQLGLEDFTSDDERRIISAARNLYSGVLLLAKEVLRQLSPPGSNDILIRIKKKAVKQADAAATRNRRANGPRSGIWCRKAASRMTACPICADASASAGCAG